MLQLIIFMKEFFLFYFNLFFNPVFLKTNYYLIQLYMLIYTEVCITGLQTFSFRTHLYLLIMVR